MPITLDNIAQHAWTLLDNINAAANPVSLDDFVGAAGAAIIRHQFHESAIGEIDDVTFVAQSPVPAPTPAELAAEFGYAGADPAADLQRDVVADLDATTWRVLEQFGGGGAFVGITYDRVVWVTDASLLDTVLHELVHTLQWKHFGQQDFLSRYVGAFAGRIAEFVVREGRPPANALESFGIYRSNPAETSAYGHQQQFIDAANTALGGAFDLQTAVTIAAMRTAGGGNRSADEVREALVAQPSVGIRTTSAINGM